MSLPDEVAAARKRIFRDGYDISFGELVSLYEKQELIIQPEYQRLFRWDQTQKTRFIESLLLNIPIPPIFVFSDENGRWELVDGLQRVSTVLEFMGLRRDADGILVPPFACDGTTLLPSLKGALWPQEEAVQGDPAANDGAQPAVQDGLAAPVVAAEPNPSAEEELITLPLPLQLTVRRSRVRVEILSQETDAHAKYELFQRLNSGGTNLSEQELRNCVIIAINRDAFDRIKRMVTNSHFQRLAKIGEDRINRQYLNELVVRFIVLRNHEYKRGMDVHEYLDNGVISVAEDKSFDWDAEQATFDDTMRIIFEAAGEDAFLKNSRFSLAMFEFITLGLSRAVDREDTLDLTDMRERIASVQSLPAALRYSGIGVRGTQRLASFVTLSAEQHFLPR
jgi:hypothetical protein